MGSVTWNRVVLKKIAHGVHGLTWTLPVVIILTFVSPAVAGYLSLNRTGESEEIARVVNSLISEEASYTTGRIINVDGGML